MWVSVTMIDRDAGGCVGGGECLWRCRLLREQPVAYFCQKWSLMYILIKGGGAAKMATVVF